MNVSLVTTPTGHDLKVYPKNIQGLPQKRSISIYLLEILGMIDDPLHHTTLHFI